MNQAEPQEASRSVLVLLILVSLALCVFLAPGQAEGRSSESQLGLRPKSGAIDGLAISDKCLTQNRKALNWRTVGSSHTDRVETSILLAFSQFGRQTSAGLRNLEYGDSRSALLARQDDASGQLWSVSL